MGNNREMPIYDPSVRLEVTPIEDAQSSAQQLINSFEQFSGASNQIGTTVLRSEVEAQRGTIRNQIAQTYADYSFSAMQNPDKAKGLSDYNQQASSYAQDYLKQTHFWNQNYARNLLDYFANAHRAPIVRSAITQQTRQQADFVAQGINDQSQQIINAIHNSQERLDEKGNNTQFDEADALTADLFRNMRVNHEQGLINQGIYQAAIPKLTKTFMQEKIIKGYKDALDQGKGPQFLNQFEKQDIPGFTYAEKAQLANGPFKQIRNQYVNQYGISIKALNNQLKGEYEQLENGATPNTTLQNAVMQTQPVEVVKDYEKQVAISQAVWHAKQAASTLNSLDAQHYIESYKPTDPNDPNFNYQNLMYKRVGAAIRSSIKAFYEDPVAQSKDDPNLKEAQVNYQLAKEANATGTNFLHSPVNSQTTHPDYAISYMQERRGLSVGGPKVDSIDTSVRFMTNPEAQMLVTKINQADPVQKIQIFNNLRQESANGTFYNARIKQLVHNGMPASFAVLGNIDPSSPYSHQIVEAISTPLKTLEEQFKDSNAANQKDTETKVKEAVEITSPPGFWARSAGNSGSNHFANYMSSLAAYSGEKNIQFKESLKNTLKSLSYYAQLKNIASGPEEAVNWAKGVIAERYQYTVMNGQTIRFPKDMDEKTLKDYAAQQQTLVENFPFMTAKATPYIRSDVSASEIDHENIMRGHWANDPLESGLIWVDQMGRGRTDPKGNFLKITFDDAKRWHETGTQSNFAEEQMHSALLGNATQEQSNNQQPQKTEQGVVDRQKMGEIDHQFVNTDTKIEKEIFNKNIPLFKSFDQTIANVREPNVYQASARGLRNNNPGNIKKTAERWSGEVAGTDPVFKTFKSPEAGIKAMSSLLTHYADKGINTVNQLVRRWSSTDQRGYINHITTRLGIDPNEPINLKDKNIRGAIMEAMIEFENGRNPYGQSTIMGAI
jgi:hypothetical protein